MGIIVTLTEKLLGIGVIVVLAFTGYFVFVNHQQKVGYEKAVAEYEHQLTEQRNLTKAATDKLAAQKEQADKEKQSAIAKVQSDSAALISSLRNRATRAEASKAGSNPIAATESTCSGVGLYRDDAEFLVGFAQHAAEVQVERDYYYEQYEYARNLLSGQISVSGQQGTVPNSKSVP